MAQKVVWMDEFVFSLFFIKQSLQFALKVHDISLEAARSPILFAGMA